MKKFVLLLLALAMLLTMAACGATKTLHCDGCGTEVTVEASSNMEEDWIIFCGECNEELFGEDGLVAPSN